MRANAPGYRKGSLLTRTASLRKVYSPSITRRGVPFRWAGGQATSGGSIKQFQEDLRRDCNETRGPLLLRPGYLLLNSPGSWGGLQTPGKEVRMLG